MAIISHNGAGGETELDGFFVERKFRIFRRNRARYFEGCYKMGVDVVKRFPGQQIQIARLQKNLPALRKIAGWTMEELGRRIGVTKQTVSNLENPNRKSAMTLTQCLAIRAALDYEAARRLAEDEGDTLLLQAIRKVLDEELDGASLQEAEENVALLASAVAGKTPREKVRKLADETIPLSSAFQGTALSVNLGGGLAGYLSRLFSEEPEQLR